MLDLVWFTLLVAIVLTGIIVIGIKLTFMWFSALAELDSAKAAPQRDRSCTLCQCGESKKQSDLK